MRHSIEFTVQKLSARLPAIQKLIHRRRAPMQPFRYTTLPGPEGDPLIGPEIDDSGWEEIPFNSYWGDWTTDFMLRTRFRVPKDWNPTRPVALHLPLGEAGDIFCHPEGLAYIDGDIIASADRQHHEIYLPERFCQGDEHLIALHGWTGHNSWPPDPSDRTQLYMKQCEIVEIDVPTRDFYLLSKQAIEVAQSQSMRAAAQMQILDALNAAFEILDTRAPMSLDSGFYDTVPPALEALRAGLQGGAAPLNADIIAVGHAHIDIAYLWRVNQTRRKAGRTFSNVLQLMDQHPDYHFSQSQAWLYAAVERDYPEIFAQIVDRVHEGRWEPMGGMWVEPDCNLAGGEALVRQLMLGRSYFQEKFGVMETAAAWLPDTFGFTASLPQLLRQAGLKWFGSNKLNWNQYNRLPHNLFEWEGIDGSRITAFFLTTPRDVQYLPFPTTYKAEMTAKEVFGTWDNFDQKSAHSELPICFGYGDGGGGPTRELIMTARNFGRIPGVPKVRMGTMREFFEGVSKRRGEELPVWNGELYLELHRGTFTSQAGIKKKNRKSEIMLRDLEFLASYAAQACDFSYPSEPLEEAWKLVCLNQFHDILPGTSLPEVFEDADADYARVDALLSPLLKDAENALSRAEGTGATAINTAPFTMDRLATIDVEGPLSLSTGEPLASQPTDAGQLTLLPAAPAFGVVGVVPGATHAPETTLTTWKKDGTIGLENHLIAVEIDPNGQLARIWDKTANRDVLAPGQSGNQLLAFEDRPMQWDAWDIDIFYEDRCDAIDTPSKVALTETGPVRATVRVEFEWRGSKIVQDIRLYSHSKRIDFDTVIDWRAQKTLLKAAFPVDILAKDATYDIQFGNMRRPTHRNTSWDWARFEVVGHKWADLSEGNYGVALLNDCKYGYDIQENVMRLSLLKGATMPDPTQDMGHHSFTYALFPHEGGWRNGVVAQGYDLNMPMRVTAGAPQDIAPFVTCTSSNAVIETIKRAEDGNGHIVRLYEVEQNRGPVRLEFGFDLAAVERTQILEEAGTPVELLSTRSVEVDLKPYEIATLRVLPA